MDKSTNRKGRIWLLARTSEGPLLAERLLQQGWSLEVSVSTLTAARSYPLSPYLNVQIELLDGENLLTSSIVETRLEQKMFKWVVDATYPFASTGIDYLMQVCRNLQQPVLRLKRCYQSLHNFKPVNSIDDLDQLELINERILPIVSIQDLISLCSHYKLLYFGLIPPDPLALQLATSAGLPADRLACLLPFSIPQSSNRLEYALCKHWGITLLLFCQSGCPSERSWYAMAQRLGIRYIFMQNTAYLDNDYSFSPEELLKILQ